eukprot:UN06623
MLEMSDSIDMNTTTTTTSATSSNTYTSKHYNEFEKLHHFKPLRLSQPPPQPHTALNLNLSYQYHDFSQQKQSQQKQQNDNTFQNFNKFCSKQYKFN